MADAAKNEPSMDDILSSIRKIVSQDDRRTGSNPGSANPQQPPASAEKITAETETAAVAPPQQPARRAEDQPEQFNLASLAGMVRGQLPRADDAATQRPNPAPSPESLQARQQPSPQTKEVSDKPEKSQTLADLQRTVSSHFQPTISQTASTPKVDDSPRPDVTADDEIQSDLEKFEKALVSKPAPSATPPEGAMTLKDLAKIDKTAMTSMSRRDSAAELVAQALDHPDSLDIEPVAETIDTSPDPVETPDRVETEETAKEKGGTTDVEAGAFREALVAPATQTAVAGSLDRLKKSVMDDLDARVETVLRPMLREWLDNNLPAMVEKAVREEIERIARQA
ncbi:MAG: DUF2497 domain-containing protein [Pseudomonadota bacterium]